jgi:hypothetical protein
MTVVRGDSQHPRLTVLCGALLCIGTSEVVEMQMANMKCLVAKNQNRWDPG